MKHREVGHYASIVAVLLAGGVQARLVSNGTDFSIEVKPEDGGRVYWGNKTEVWAWIEVTKDGETRQDDSILASDAEPEVVAKMIYWVDSDVSE